VVFFAFMLRVLAGYPAHLRDPKGDILSIADIFDVPAFTAAKGSAPVVRDFFQGAQRPFCSCCLHGPRCNAITISIFSSSLLLAAFCETTLFVKFLEDRTFRPDEDGRHVFVDDHLPSVPVPLAPAAAAPATAPRLLQLPALERVGRPSRVYTTFAPEVVPSLAVRIAAFRFGGAASH